MQHHQTIKRNNNVSQNNQFKVKDNKNIIIIKIADNKGVIIESYENSSLAGKQTAILVAMQSLKAQAMAKVLVEEGLEIQFSLFQKLNSRRNYGLKNYNTMLHNIIKRL